MRYVLKNNDEVAHYWANQILPRGRNGGHSFSFEGACLFSYREPIALYIGGTSTCLFSSRSWSITTSHHQSMAHRASRAMREIYVPHLATTEGGMRLEHDKNRQHFEKEFVKVSAWLDEPRRKRSREKNLRYLNDVIETYTDYSNLFGLDWPALDNADAIKQEWAKAAAEEEARRQREEAEQIAREAEDLAKWRSGEDMRRWFMATALRVKDSMVQTSQGAEIPVDHATRVWPLLCRIKRSGKVFTPNGHSVHLGVYKLDSFDGELLIAGCHRIPWAEISSIAAALGLPPYNQGDNDGRERDGASDGGGQRDCDGEHHAREGNLGDAGEAAELHGG